MTQPTPELEHAPPLMTRRPGAKLAHKYGYHDVLDFARSLPAEARVADVGAGLSTFGMQVCNFRGDIEWFNIDTQYGDFPDDELADRFDILLENKPKNLRYETADALDLIDVFGEGQLDAVFSYAMPQYITLESRTRGLDAAETILRTAKPGGRVAVGAITRPWYSMAALLGRAMEVTPSSDEATRNAQADAIVARTSLYAFQENGLRYVMQKNAPPAHVL